MAAARIGFIGLGRMGVPMVGNLLRAGFEVAGFDARRQHDLAAADRDFHVGESQVAVGGRHEILALDDKKQVENLRIQNLPRTDLLFDHVEACLLDVHLGLRRLNISMS